MRRINTGFADATIRYLAKEIRPPVSSSVFALNPASAGSNQVAEATSEK
jgi:hypothetical protein